MSSLVDTIEKIKFNQHGLVPAIIQEVGTNQVLMLAYMNRESLEKTLKTGKTWFWSRSRKELWNKGGTSGHFQLVKAMAYDCDADTLLIKVEQLGPACHTGEKSCFFNEIVLPLEGAGNTGQSVKDGESAGAKANNAEVLAEVFAVIKQRQAELPEGSYTTYLFDKGIDKILKKVGEEAGEVIIASKNEDKGEITYESADLIYHLMVTWAYHGLTWQDIFAELAKRR